MILNQHLIQGVIKFPGDFITPKFYSREIYQDLTIDDVIDKVNARIEQERKGPRDLYRYPILSSQRYFIFIFILNKFIFTIIIIGNI